MDAWIDRWTDSSPRQKISFMPLNQLIDNCCYYYSSMLLCEIISFGFCVKDFCLSCLPSITSMSGSGRSVFLCHHPSSSIRDVFCSAPRTPGLPVSTPEGLWEPVCLTKIGFEVSSFNTSVKALHQVVPVPSLHTVSDCCCDQHVFS